jgi:regulator of cell morphogenesis and NO signaling
MLELDQKTHVATIARQMPATIKVLQRHRIDFCCGGKRPLAEACAEVGVDADRLLVDLRAAAAGPQPEGDWGAASARDLAAHIVERYHEALRRDLPVLRELALKVAARHGDQHPQLAAVRANVEALAAELTSHMAKEEQVLFPLIARLEQGEAGYGPPVQAPIEMMEHEHDEVAELLHRLRTLTAGYQPPANACNSFRGLYQLLAEIETDTQMHIHLENNVLFPRALETAAQVVA